TACGELETAGLKELVQRSGAHVVASSEGLDAVRQMCPSGTVVVPAQALARNNWFPVTPISLGGRGVAPVAYLIKWDDRNVLFSGTIPGSIGDGPPTELVTELARSRENALAYNAALERLAEVKPELWLPTVPHQAPNANLFDGEWARILEKNRRAAAFVLQSSPGR